MNENKNRTEKWLQALGLQLPSAITKFGSITSIRNPGDKVNKKFSQRDPAMERANKVLKRENERLKADGRELSFEDAFEEALADASENFQRAEKNTADGGGDVKNSVGDGKLSADSTE